MLNQKAIMFLFFTLLLVGCAKNNGGIPAVKDLTQFPITAPVYQTGTATDIPLYPSVTPFSGTPDANTEIPLASNTVPGISGKKTLTPTNTKTPTSTPTITKTPTETFTPTNTPTPSLDSDLFLLQIVSPGPMSKVVSPIELVLHIAAAYTGLTRIELIGEDGAKLYVKPFRTYPNLGYFTRVDEIIPFEIRGAAELARLQISTFDDQGRLQAYNSIHLLLQAVGDNEITSTATVQDRLILRFPNEKQLITGGNLPVLGVYNPANDLPVIVELLADDGTVMGSRILQLEPGDGTYQEFTTSIPYLVTKPTSARLVIRQSDDRMDGMAYLYSRLVILAP